MEILWADEDPRMEAKEGSHKTSSFAAAAIAILKEGPREWTDDTTGGAPDGTSDGRWLVGQGKGEEHLFPERRSSRANKSCCLSANN